MHEYAIAEELVTRIDDVAREHGAEVVGRVVIQVGKLRAVVPEILRWGFGVAAENSVAAGAELEIEEVPIIIHCRACETDTELADPLFICPECGGGDVAQVSGDELILKSVEIGDEGDPGRSEHPPGQ